MDAISSLFDAAEHGRVAKFQQILDDNPGLDVNNQSFRQHRAAIHLSQGMDTLKL